MPQRQIVLDTETTGLEVSAGHRVIEIGGVEIVNRRLTGKTVHYYLQPDRLIDPQAFEVHGISNEFLADKPRFAEIAQEFLEFINGAELVIHNAAFDLGFINAEFSTWGHQTQAVEQICSVTDTLELARQRHPGQRNSLDALCKRYGVDNSRRDLHGALLDAEILADVFLAMTGGQTALQLETSAGQVYADSPDEPRSANHRIVREGLTLRILRASEIEQQQHLDYLNRLEKSGSEGCVWLTLSDHTA